ncbi:DUF5825 family protein [Catenuloplanes japonicus]|uniref:DUF5825 family protein n=1 Tax=Catenuloplanes japonicus TaxID=33876 RepID=UPI000526F984|nr:DUF5825 family protein [Catenuloplanes japonicus]
MSPPSAEAVLFRDYHPAVADMPGMSLGARRLTGPAGPLAANLRRDGVRHVRLPAAVRLCADADPDAAWTVALLRELTAHGLSVDWTADCGCGLCEPLFRHLHPPATDDGPWRQSFYLGKCVCRRGPGFAEVRDRRTGVLEMFTIDAPAHLAAIDRARDGADEVPEELIDSGLAIVRAGRVWWLPTSVYRWPFPALII